MLEITGVSHRYGNTETLRDVSLTLAEGDVACILGPSGCGKTTLLRTIAGFEKIGAGAIQVHGEALSDAHHHVPAELRRVGMVFQDYALLPHLSAADNVAFGLHRLPRAQATETAAKMLQRVGLADLAHRFPHELSGGQQQRVAIARALAPQPSLLLMDEPFSNIDAGMRADLGADIRALLKVLGATALVATHDHQDAFAIGDHIGILRDGRLLQWDTSYNVYHQPADRFTAGFVGLGAWLPGTVREASAVETELGLMRGKFTHPFAVDQRVDVFLRPDDVVHDDNSERTAVVAKRRFGGADFLYELQLPSGATVLSAVPSHHDHAVGEAIGIRLETEHLVLFAAE